MWAGLAIEPELPPRLFSFWGAGGSPARGGEGCGREALPEAAGTVQGHGRSVPARVRPWRQDSEVRVWQEEAGWGTQGSTGVPLSVTRVLELHGTSRSALDVLPPPHSSCKPSSDF